MNERTVDGPQPVETPPVEPEAVLTSEQVAKLLGVSMGKLLPMLARGEGPPCMRIGRTYRFRPSALARWQADRERAQSAGRDE